MMKKLMLLLSLVSVSAFASTEVCVKATDAQIEGLFERWNETLKSGDAKKCRCQVFRANQEGLETVYGTVG